MDMKLQNQRALITGATKGIGFAIAHRLVQEGSHVIITGRNNDALASAQQRLGGPEKATTLCSDLATTEGAQFICDEVKKMGTIDILVNNVGFFEVRNFFETSDAHWIAMFELNVMSGVRLSRSLMPQMLQRNHGRIVFIASEQSLKPNPEMAHYAMSKTAQVSVARALAELTRGTNVTVNSILVAPTWTEGVEHFLEPLAKTASTSVAQMRTEYFKGDGTSSLLQRFAEPNEIADVVSFVVSPLASAINGTALRADGGIVRAIF
jgi:NAD(P)-dependent dehydrogenase (short-subunit alcohol dehydrogenase family)